MKIELREEVSGLSGVSDVDSDSDSSTEVYDIFVYFYWKMCHKISVIQPVNMDE